MIRRDTGGNKDFITDLRGIDTSGGHTHEGQRENGRAIGQYLFWIQDIIQTGFLRGV
jgi:hypothetical protein